MTMKCWYLACYGTNFSSGGRTNQFFESCVKATSVTTVEHQKNGYTFIYPVIDGHDTYDDGGYGLGTADAFVACRIATSEEAARLGCVPDSAPNYDCLNGNCIISTQYKTPGIYQSLTDCQAVCASGGACAEGKQCVDPTTFCPDGKVCIDQGEFSSIEALISKIGSEVC